MWLSSGAAVTADVFCLGYLALFRTAIFCDSAARMLAEIYSAPLYGVDAYEVEIEVNGTDGDPTIVIVG